MEKTQELSQALHQSTLPIAIVDPAARETFVMRKDEYTRLIEEDDHEKAVLAIP